MSMLRDSYVYVKGVIYPHAARVRYSVFAEQPLNTNLT